MKKKKKTKQSKKRTEDIHDEAFNAAERIVELTDAFCLNHLNEDYRELCEDLTWGAYEEKLPLEKGKPASWASGIVHAIGFINFLHDPSQSPHMTSAQLADGFEVSQQTMQNKSKIIRDEFDLMQMDPDWCLPSLVGDNPLVWMLEVDGFIIDLREAPRKAQEQAYQLGLIPYIPSDRLKPEPPAEFETKIIQFPSGQSKPSEAQSAQKQNDEWPNLFE